LTLLDPVSAPRVRASSGAHLAPHPGSSWSHEVEPPRDDRPSPTWFVEGSLPHLQSAVTRRPESDLASSGHVRRAVLLAGSGATRATSSAGRQHVPHQNIARPRSCRSLP